MVCSSAPVWGGGLRKIWRRPSSAGSWASPGTPSASRSSRLTLIRWIRSSSMRTSKVSSSERRTAFSWMASASTARLSLICSSWAATVRCACFSTSKSRCRLFWSIERPTTPCSDRARPRPAARAAAAATHPPEARHMSSAMVTARQMEAPPSNAIVSLRMGPPLRIARVSALPGPRSNSIGRRGTFAPLDLQGACQEAPCPPLTRPTIRS